MTMHFRALADSAMADGTITPDEILALRRAGWADGKMTPEEAEAIFVANDHVRDPDHEWCDFFLEAVTEFAVNGTEPRGHIEPARADWLIARASHDGRLDTLTELELLVRALEKSQTTPERLRTFVLEQLEQAVLTGTGPTRSGGAFAPGSVTEGECQLLRRAIFAAGGDRPGGVSLAEAEMLYRIKDAALDGNNSPEWKRLFVQGVGNYLQGFTVASSVSRERAAELETFMADNRPSIGRFFGRMATSGSGLANNFGVVFGRRKEGLSFDSALDSQVAEGAALTDSENTWLQDHIDANDVIDSYDEALLAFLAEEA